MAKMIGIAAATTAGAMRGKGKPCPCCWTGRHAPNAPRRAARLRQADRQAQRARERRTWRNDLD